MGMRMEGGKEEKKDREDARGSTKRRGEVCRESRAASCRAARGRIAAV